MQISLVLDTECLKAMLMKEAAAQIKINNLLQPLATQQSTAAANRELITRFEKKIQATLARVWGEDGA